MILYHSSYLAVCQPDILHSRDGLDFGKGFYLTSLYSQAVSYAQRFLRRNKEAWISSYDFTFSEEDWKIRQFDAYDEEWLEFISKCRMGIDNSDYDLIIGGIANDKVIRTLDRYFEGELTVNQALGILKFEHPNIQYCIRNQTMLDNCLNHIESKQL